MHLDNRGLPLSTASAKAAAAFDHLITGYLTQRADTPARLAVLLEADPDFALAHCMKGYFAMLGFKQATIPAAVQLARTAQSLAADATPRERSHIAALTAWSEGELDRAIWLGRPQDMVASVERVIPAWSEDVPGYASMLSAALDDGADRHRPHRRCGAYDRRAACSALLDYRRKLEWQRCGF